MNMKQKIAIIILLAALFIVAVVCPGIWFTVQKQKWQHSEDVHIHSWALWSAPSQEIVGRNIRYTQFRSCTNCGLAEVRYVEEAK